MSIRVAVADGDTLFREGLCLLIDRESDMEVVGRAGRTDSLPAMIRRIEPDILILGMETDTGGGEPIGRRLERAFPSLPVLALRRHSSRGSSGMKVKRGFATCLNRTSTLEELRQAIRRLAG